MDAWESGTAETLILLVLGGFYHAETRRRGAFNAGILPANDTNYTNALNGVFNYEIGERHEKMALICGVSLGETPGKFPPWVSPSGCCSVGSLWLF